MLGEIAKKFNTFMNTREKIPSYKLPGELLLERLDAIDASASYVPNRIKMLLNEADNSGDTKRIIFALLQTTEAWLEEMYLIKDLSTIEELKLRQIIEQCYEQQEKEIEAKTDGKWIFDIEVEATERWLRELYGISQDNIPMQHIIRNKTNNELFCFDSKKEYAEIDGRLRDQGIRENYSHYSIPTDDFMEYLRRLREDANKI